MIPLHSLLPELAQREVRCLHLGDAPGGPPGRRSRAKQMGYQPPAAKPEDLR